MQKSSKVFLFTGLAFLGLGFFAFGTNGRSLAESVSSKPQEELLSAKMRTLWTDHIVFTRFYIVSALAGLKDKDTVAARLLENQDEIATIFKPYYGLTFSKDLAALLRAHINIAAEVVAAAQSGSEAAMRKAQARWSANGAEITALLSAANPHWEAKEIAAMLQDHLELTSKEVAARLAKDWAGDLKNFEDLQAHMLMFSDFLVAGLERQFRKDPKRSLNLMESLAVGGR